MPQIKIADAPKQSGTRYPPPYDKPCLDRAWLRLGDAAGLTQFGVNLVRLPPGTWSSQRHWHSHEDEFVYILEGEVVLRIQGRGPQWSLPAESLLARSQVTGSGFAD
jgi:uncharacterized cupin superfamily protein